LHFECTPPMHFERVEVKTSARAIEPRVVRVSAGYGCTMTTVPLLGSIWIPCHPSRTGGAVKRNTRIASMGARLMQP